MAKILIDIGKVIKVVVLTALAAFTIVACQKNEDISMENDISVKVIQSILDHNEIQQYLHPDIENRLPIRVLTNNFFSPATTITKFDEPVLFLAEMPTEPYFEITKFEHSGDYIEFTIRYEVEGVSISGKASVEGNEVTLTVFDVVES